MGKKSTRLEEQFSCASIYPFSFYLVISQKGKVYIQTLKHLRHVELLQIVSKYTHVPNNGL